MIVNTAAKVSLLMEFWKIMWKQFILIVKILFVIYAPRLLQKKDSSRHILTLSIKELKITNVTFGKYFFSFCFFQLRFCLKSTFKLHFFQFSVNWLLDQAVIWNIMSNQSTRNNFNVDTVKCKYFFSISWQNFFSNFQFHYIFFKFQDFWIKNEFDQTYKYCS